MALEIGMLLFPRLTQLDLTGPFELLHRIPDARVHLVWKDLAPVRADSGLVLQPTATLVACPPLDVVFVPGGFGQGPLATDEGVLGFLRHHGEGARYVSSVCTGALLLGAAGLLAGYRATTHWAYLDWLPRFGAIPSPGRVIIDRNRITGGGVTSGPTLPKWSPERSRARTGRRGSTPAGGSTGRRGGGGGCARF